MWALIFLLWPYQAASQKIPLSQANVPTGVLTAIQNLALNKPVPSEQAIYLQEIATEAPKGQATTAQIAAEKAQEALEQAQAAQVVYEAPQAQAEALAVPSGSHTDWMAAAGISPSDYGYANYIVSHESGWDATNWYGKSLDYPYNPATSAAGLPQALPYSKTGCAWGDAICQLRWANSYAQAVYNGWYNAYIHWLNFHSW